MEAQIKLPELHAGQLRIMREAKRRNVISAGRRWGKNILLQDLAIDSAISGHFVGWAAPVFKQTHDDFRAIQNLCAPIIRRVSVSEMRLEFITGGVVEFWSADHADAIRGKKYHRFIVNEAGFVPDLLSIRNFVIMPTLIDYQGDEWYSGTPKGMNGFWNLYNQRGEDWMRWLMSSYDNPHIPAKELDDLKNVMTERAYMQEICAQFIEDGGGVFRNVRACATAKPLERGESGRQYIIGVDWGRSNDATVFSVIDLADKRQVYLDRMMDTDFASQRGRLIALAERFNHAIVIAEANSIGQPNIEALQNAGLYVQPFITTNATKASIIQALELAFERGEITLLDDEVQVNELIAYQADKLPSGLMRYGSPEGLHDDCVMALAISLTGTTQGRIFA